MTEFLEISRSRPEMGQPVSLASSKRKAVHFQMLLLLAGLIGLAFSVKPVAAHTEGVMQLAAEPAGPYMLTVWTAPDPVQVGELHVAMAVVQAEDALPVLEADVLVRLTPADGGPAMSGPATTENSENKFLHEAILDVEKSGDYQVEIFVEGADGGRGEVSFPLVVEGGNGPNWVLVLVVAAVVAAAAILIIRLRRNA